MPYNWLLARLTSRIVYHERKRVVVVVDYFLAKVATHVEKQNATPMQLHPHVMPAVWVGVEYQIALVRELLDRFSFIAISKFCCVVHLWTWKLLEILTLEKFNVKTVCGCQLKGLKVSLCYAQMQTAFQLYSVNDKWIVEWPFSESNYFWPLHCFDLCG